MTTTDLDRAGVMPRRRLAGLVIRDVDDECLVYDEATDSVILLDEITLGVWRRCDGSTARELVRHDLGIDDDTLAVSLGKVAEAGLLEADGFTRRGLIARAASVGALVSLSTIAAPTAAMAASAPAPIIGTVSLIRLSCTRGTSNLLGSSLSFTVRLTSWAPSTTYSVRISTPALPGPNTLSGTLVTATRSVTTAANRQGSVTVSIRVPRNNVQNPTPIRVQVAATVGGPALLSTPVSGTGMLSLASC